MKRGKSVISRAMVKTGRRMAVWGATGMNWAPGEYRDAVITASRNILGSGKGALDALGRRFDGIDRAERRVGEAGEGAPASCWWQAGASRLLIEFPARTFVRPETIALARARADAALAARAEAEEALRAAAIDSPELEELAYEVARVLREREGSSTQYCGWGTYVDRLAEEAIEDGIPPKAVDAVLRGAC